MINGLMKLWYVVTVLMMGDISADVKLLSPEAITMMMWKTTQRPRPMFLH